VKPRHLLILALVVVAAGCSANAADAERPELDGPTAPATGPTGLKPDAVAPPEDSVPPSPEADPEASDGPEDVPPDDDPADDASEDDLRVFGFATTDEAAVAAELAAITGTVGALAVDLQTRDLDAAEADARALLDQAETIGVDAEAAEGRQRPLEPEDPDLARARRHAVDAFGLTAAYANSVTDIANAVLGGSPGELPALVSDAAELAGTSDELAQAYTDLNEELAAWAEANPVNAARAVATYGT
jgi:hypothetical protein